MKTIRRRIHTVLRRSAAIFLALAMMAAFIPSVSEPVHAVEVAEPPSSSTYIDVSELNEPDMNYGLTSGKRAQAVYFGTNAGTAKKQKWWIAGFDESGLVLMCDPRQPLIEESLFSSSAKPKDYDAAYGTYENAPSNPVYPSHYGASELRGVLNSLAADESYFTQSEKARMKNTTVYTYDYANDTTYSTADKLYPATTCFGKEEITVGQNRVDSSKSGNEQVDNGLKIGLKSGKPYGSPFTDSASCNFWTRSPSDYSTYSNYAFWANPSNKVFEGLIDGTYNTMKQAVVPAFALDTSTVLFASLADAATEYNAMNTEGVMTFRCDGTDKISSTATFTGDSVSVDYDDSDGDVYLYVQGSEPGEYWSSYEWVSSQRIDESVDFPASAIRSGANLTNCKVWLETVEDNIAYAKPASYTGTYPRPLYGIITPPVAKSYSYTGREITGIEAVPGCRVVGWSAGSSVGSYMVNILLEYGYIWSDGTTEPKTITWQIIKAPNPMKLKSKTATVKKSKVKKKAQKLARSKVLTFSKGAKGKVTYKKLSGSSKLSIAKTTGNVTVKKKTRKGTYKIKVKVTAAGTSSYKALSRNVTVTVKVK